MNVLSSSPSLSQYSGVVLPLVALGLAQLIHGFSENWRQHFQPESDFPPGGGNLESYYEYYKNYYDSLNKEEQAQGRSGSRSLPTSKRRKHFVNVNATSRDDYTPASDSTKTISSILPSVNLPELPKPTVVAYRRTLHNVSWAVTIPLFTFLLPIAGSGDPVSLGNQALYGFFAALIVIIGFGVPILFNGQIPKTARSMQSRKLQLNHLMHPGHLMNIVGLNLENQIGVDPIQCLQKTVCEAYRSPQNERYGMLVWPIKYFFPAKNVSDDSARSIYEIAAKDGKFTDVNCRKKYSCMFDVLDLASYCITMYQKAKKEARQKLNLDLDESESDSSKPESQNDLRNL